MMTTRTVGRATRIAYVVAVAVFLVLVGRFYQKGTGMTSLIHFGDRFYDRSLPAVRYAPHAVAFGSAGDDGQFYAQLAVEPLLRNRQLDAAIDNPAYRARRILVPWLAFVMGLGETKWILQAYALVNVLTWLVLAWLLASWLPPSHPRNLLPWLGCLFGAGLGSSVRLAMIDGPAVLFVALAVWAADRRRLWWASGLLGLAGLARETSLMCAPSLWAGSAADRSAWGRAAARVAVAAAPFLLWTMYVKSVFPAFSYSSPDSFSLPFAGVLAGAADAMQGIRDWGWMSSGGGKMIIVVSLAVQFLYLAFRWRPQEAWWRAAAPTCVLFASTSVAVWGGFPTAAPRVLLPMTIAFNVLVARETGWRYWTFAVSGNVSILVGLTVLRLPGLPQLL